MSASEWVRSCPRVAFASASAICAINAALTVSIEGAKGNGETIFASVILTVLFGLATVAATAFSEAR